LAATRTLALAVVTALATVEVAAQSGGATQPRSDQKLAQAKGKEPAPPPATAPSPAETSVPWAVNCSNRQGAFACEMVQQIVDARSRAVLLMMSINKPREAGPPAILFRTVHGVYLPAGLSVQVDQRAPIRIDFQKSDGAGVYAALPLPPDLVADLKKARELVLETAMSKEQKLIFKAPMTGFSGAFDRVMEAK
jgi:invasion protein IalB